MEQSLFWADQIANEIITRKKFRFTGEPAPKPEKYVVKSAASVSGVLHIGRLSDTIRCDSVFKALKDAGHKAKFIWTADNVDPLRKIPEGVPESYRQYIGVPVADIPDPWGCHKSYEEHHRTAYLDVVFKFIHDKMKTYSMREEYLKGTFKKEITLILKNTKLLIDIQNKYRTPDRKLSHDWSPWQPICRQCGKIITPRITKMREDGKAEYICRDYQFKTETAKGCGYEGIDDPLKGNGKLMYKGELAAQWAHWKVATEGFGKEYQVPGSALWINGEITERVLHFPMTVPIIYEHIMIDGRKMSASLGNVVYPKDWLECAPAELLRFFYNKRLMKTRSFSWKELPLLYLDYEKHAGVYFGKEKVENKKEEAHMKRLFEISQLGKPKEAGMTFEQAMLAANTNPAAKGKMIAYAKNWMEKHSPDSRVKLLGSPGREGINEAMRSALRSLAYELREARTEEDVSDSLWAAAKATGDTKEFFRSAYLALIGREHGPKLAPFIMDAGKEKIAKLLEKL